MALSDIVSNAFDPANSSIEARGNIGTLTDELLAAGDPRNQARHFFTQPTADQVQTGIQFGQQGTQFTGTLSGGGGGNTYTRGRVVNG